MEFTIKTRRDLPVDKEETGRRRDAEAARRFQMIAPLLQDGLDEAKKIELRKKIARDNDVSPRTVYRYEKAYRERQFEGLKPAKRSGKKGGLPDNYDELVEEAIRLRRELPERSVDQIIWILESEGKVAPNVLKRSTLERRMFEAGYGRTHMEMYKETRDSSAKRFCKPHRMMLVQGDIKYGPSLPIGKNGAKVKTYLSSLIDDHSRFVIQSAFYLAQDEKAVEDTFHRAILRYGRFDACYVDNGKQYVSVQLKQALSRLGIRISHAPLRSGKSKGKVEKYHQIVSDFNREIKLEKIRSLDELNRKWDVFLNEYYHKKPHEGIREYYESMGVDVPPEGISPLAEFNRDSRPLSYFDASAVGEAFRHREKRKVDRGGCISFRGKKYETKPSLIGRTITVSYDPLCPDKIIAAYADDDPFELAPLKLEEYCNQVKYELPDKRKEPEPEGSRFLDAAEKKHEKSVKNIGDAISFASYNKEDKKDV